MELMMQATLVLTIVNVALLMALGVIYGRNWLDMRSPIGAGLLLFTLAFLAQYVTSLYMYIANMAYFVEMVSMHAFIVTALQTLAFAVLNIISWR